MKVLALNGSPRLEKSGTYRMLYALLKGMQKAGAETELIHIRRLHLKPCNGCFLCWYGTPGDCVHKDGMDEILPKMVEADLIIFGTPLYFFQMTGEMKTFIDRLLPLSQPELITRSDDPTTTGHPSRYGHKKQGVVLVSPCGFPEVQNFEALVHSFKFLASKMGWNYLGEILRSGGEPLAQNDLQPFFSAYYAQLSQAGEQLIRDGKVSDGLQEQLKQDLFPGGKEEFITMANAYWNTKKSAAKAAIEKQNEKEIYIMNTVNQPTKQSNRLREYMSRLPSKFLPAAAGDFRGDIQFDFSGAEAGQYYLAIENSGCRFVDGLSASPKLVIHSSSETWSAIGRGELSGPEAFMSGKLKADGDFGLLMKWRSFFSAN
jgi:multimeric flavodoxin WrbA